jgi:hypothetical protein
MNSEVNSDMSDTSSESRYSNIDAYYNENMMTYNQSSEMIHKIYELLQEQNERLKVIEMNQKIILKTLNMPQIERPIPVRPSTTGISILNRHKSIKFNNYVNSLSNKLFKD